MKPPFRSRFKAHTKCRPSAIAMRSSPILRFHHFGSVFTGHTPDSYWREEDSKHSFIVSSKAVAMTVVDPSGVRGICELHFAPVKPSPSSLQQNRGKRFLHWIPKRLLVASGPDAGSSWRSQTPN